MLIGAISYPVGQIAAWLAWPFAAATIHLVQLWSKLPSASIPLSSFNGTLIVSYYGLLFSVTYLIARPDRLGEGKIRAWFKESFSPALWLSGLTLISLLAWHAYLRRPDGWLHVRMLDVGSGDSILVSAPGGGRILIDGGASSNRLGDRLSHYTSLFDNRIDWLIIAGNDYEQLGGLLSLAGRYPVEKAMIGVSDLGSTGRRVLEELNQHSVETIQPSIGSKLDLGRGATLELLALDPQGLMLSIKYGELRILLMPGADPPIATISPRPDRVQWSAVFLSGCGPPPSEDLPIRRMTTTALVLACEAGSAPAPGADPALDWVNPDNILRTDVNGDIELNSDGHQLWIEVERIP
jgi:beta-lactamase superfamily II metal-dependent hydrolase